MNLLTKAHPETHEALNNARAAYQAKKITREQLNDFVLSLFKVEAEIQILGHYPENLPFVDPAPVTAEDDKARMAGWESGEGFYVLTSNNFSIRL